MKKGNGTLIATTDEEAYFLQVHPRNKSNTGLTRFQVEKRAMDTIFQSTHIDDKTFYSIPLGVRIIPDDCSYIHFINNSWYE